MTPEIESLAQQLIEAAEKATQGERSISENQDGWYLAIDTGHDADIYAQFYIESEAKFAEKATPANITAVILAFREELKQARRDALSDAIGAIQRAAMHRSVQLHYKCATDAIRALMEKPE